jgi:hypothetical protein
VKEMERSERKWKRERDLTHLGVNNWGHIVVASVAEIIMDPYYRTLEGFCVLIEKDWVSLRYPFEGKMKNLILSIIHLLFIYFTHFVIYFCLHLDFY